MKKYIYIIISLLFVFSSCEKEYEKYDVDQPSFGADSMIDQTKALTTEEGQRLEGVYSISEGNDLFGDQVAIKFLEGRTSGKNQRRNSVTIFGEKDGIYAVLEIGKIDSIVVMEGYWRQANTGNTDRCRFMIKNGAGSEKIFSGNDLEHLSLRGGYMQDGNIASLQLNFSRFLTPLSDQKRPLAILAHRAGGRTSDRMSISENSVEMVYYTEHLGSHGIEIDIQLTKDSIPVVYHDGDLNIRLTQKGPIMGKISDYTYAQLSALVRLYHGEKLPTLDEMLDATVNETNILFVWLDIKEPSVMAKVTPIQEKYMKQAEDLYNQGKRKQLFILQGLPSDDMVNAFMQTDNFQNKLSLCELTLDDVRKTNAKVWAPRWTRSPSAGDINSMHNEGRFVFTWTLDAAYTMKQFFLETDIDGILTNYPTVASYYYYTLR